MATIVEYMYTLCTAETISHREVYMYYLQLLALLLTLAFRAEEKGTRRKVRECTMALYMYIDELTFLQVEACELALHLLDVFRVQEVIERGAHPVIRRLSQYVTEKKYRI